VTGRRLALILLLAVQATLPGQEAVHAIPPRELSMPKDEVWESFLGYLIGLLNADVTFELEHDDLLSVLPEFRARRNDPFELMRHVARRPGHGRQADLSFAFTGNLHIPLPVGILGYHPVFVSASETVVLEESRFDVKTIRPGAPDEAALSPALEYRMADGYGRFTFAPWLIFLSGGLLDDFSVKGVAIFKYRGTWEALMAGASRGGKVVCWLFDLKRMRLLLSIPPALLDFGAELAGFRP
jgi:hypothetical protein